MDAIRFVMPYVGLYKCICHWKFSALPYAEYIAVVYGVYNTTYVVRIWVFRYHIYNKGKYSCICANTNPYLKYYYVTLVSINGNWRRQPLFHNHKFNNIWDIYYHVLVYETWMYLHPGCAMYFYFVTKKILCIFIFTRFVYIKLRKGVYCQDKCLNEHMYFTRIVSTIATKIWSDFWYGARQWLGNQYIQLTLHCMITSKQKKNSAWFNDTD